MDLLTEINKAIGLYNTKELQAAEILCRRILEEVPDQGTVLHILGLIALDSGRSGEAFDLLSRSDQVEPGDASVLTNLGNACIDNGQHEKSLEYFRKAYAITADDLMLNLNCGTAYRLMSRFAEAEKCMEAVVAINPNHTHAIKMLNAIRLELEEPEARILEFGDDIKISLPDTLNQLTPYVIREQGQWFEAEIHFVDRFTEPGMQLVDIGANFGVYTLTMANRLQGRGKIWAFEPTPRTAGYLEDSLAANGFTNVAVVRSALSDHQGTARFSVSNFSEANRISDKPEENDVEVPITTLDDCMDAFGWAKTDFLKLDAEGHEENIITGGQRFFNELSPLVMFEVVEKGLVNWGIADHFIRNGYDLYCLVPGLGILVPFVENDPGVKMDINLFCCKKDTADALERKNLLVGGETRKGEADVARYFDEAQKQIQGMAWYQRFFGGVDLADAIGRDDAGIRYCDALRYARISAMENVAPAIRYAALRQSLIILLELTQGEAPGVSRLLTLARVYIDIHDRTKLLQTIERILAIHDKDNGFRIEEPFIPIHRDFDQQDPGEPANLSPWILAQVLDQKVARHHHSVFFTAKDSMNDLARIEATGFMRDGMKRRRDLMKERYGVG